jgi:hypothetical protein
MAFIWQLGLWATGSVVLPLYHTCAGAKAFTSLTRFSIPTELAACMKPIWNDYYSPVG